MLATTNRLRGLGSCQTRNKVEQLYRATLLLNVEIKPELWWRTEIVDGLIAIPASLYLTPNTQNTRGYGCKFRVPAGCVDAFNYSFFPTTIRDLESIAGCCRYVGLPFHRYLQVSIAGHLGDSHVNLETFVLFLTLQHVSICLWNLDLSFASRTSCTCAMHNITQLWGLCIIGKGEEQSCL